MPLLSARRDIGRADLVHRIELEVVCKVVHALHLLLSIHLEPLFDINSKILALLFKAHLGPLGCIEAVRAGWMTTLRVTDGDLVSLALDPVPHLLTRNAMFYRITSMSNSSKLFLIQLIVVLATDLFATLKSLLPSSLPNLLTSHLIKALFGSRRCLNDTR